MIRVSTVLDPVINRLRFVGLAEGVSFLVLLGVAMPLKYLLNVPMAVKVVGWIHGALFIAFGLLVLEAMRKLRWPLSRAAWAVAAALVPFGTFVLDARLKRESVVAEEQ